jgi:hypothetical protein
MRVLSSYQTRRNNQGKLFIKHQANRYGTLPRESPNPAALTTAEASGAASIKCPIGPEPSPGIAKATFVSSCIVGSNALRASNGLASAAGRNLR